MPDTEPIVVSTPTPVSVKISALKGTKVIVQSLAGLLVSVCAIKATQYCGITIDGDAQTQLTIILATGVTGLLHGAQNWLKHRMKK
jgi:hypothetical protein